MISFSQRFKQRPQTEVMLTQPLPLPVPTQQIAPMQGFGNMPFEQLVQMISQYNQQATSMGQQGRTLQASQQYGPDGKATSRVHAGRLGPDGQFRLEDELGELPGLGEGAGLQSMVRNPQTGLMVSRNTYEGQVGMKYQGPYGEQATPGPAPTGGESQNRNPQRGGRPIFGNLSSLGFSSRR